MKYDSKNADRLEWDTCGKDKILFVRVRPNSFIRHHIARIKSRGGRFQVIILSLLQIGLNDFVWVKKYAQPKQKTFDSLELAQEFALTTALSDVEFIHEESTTKTRSPDGTKESE